MRPISRIAGLRVFALIAMAMAMAMCGVASAGVGAGSLSSVRAGSLPALPVDAPLIGLTTIDGRVVALQGGGFAWGLDSSRSRWVKLALSPALDAPIRGVVSDGREAFLLKGVRAGSQPMNAPSASFDTSQIEARAIAPRPDEPRQDDTRDVLRLELAGTELKTHALPPLPFALTDAVGAASDSALYVAGLDSAGHPQLVKLTADSRWIAYNGWPAAAPSPTAGVPTSLVVQNSAVWMTVRASGAGANADGSADAAAGAGAGADQGVRAAAGERARASADVRDRVYRWSTDAGWQAVGPAPGAVVRASGRAIGQAHILYLVNAPAGAVEAAPTRLVSFHTISHAWAELPYQAPPGVVASAPWQNGIVAAHARDNGRINFETAELETGKRLLRWPDWIVIVVYLAAMIGVGLYFHLREKASAAEFFVGNRAIPFWAAGISLYATNTSSISYVAIPAKAFETNWQYLSNNLVTVLGLMFVGIWVVPLLRRLDLVSVFSYLEMRFHPAIRMLASALCILMQVGGRMSVVLFLPALAIATITGINVIWSILIMGVSTIVYTTMGGMRAVIWTDFVQVFVMIGGALFAIGFVLYALGSDNVLHTAIVNHKMTLIDTSFDLTHASIWGFVLLALFDVVLTFPKDQVLMQRALATESGKSAGRSVWIFALMTIPGGFLFYGIGTALYAYYQAHPERLDPLLPIDATFPLFIAAELPMGVTGLIIAGIFAAAMSTLSGTINSVATLVTVDFYNRILPSPSQERSLRFAEWMSVVIGAIGMGLALILSRYDIHSLLDTTIELAGLLGGGFAGAYTLGMFTRRANSAGVSIGVASAIVVTVTAWAMNLVHPYFYLGVSIFVCIVVGYCASYLFPAPTRSLAGLTLLTEKAAGG
jgi:SSS family transporter